MSALIQCVGIGINLVSADPQTATTVRAGNVIFKAVGKAHIIPGIKAISTAYFSQALVYEKFNKAEFICIPDILIRVG